ncbi:MAG: hypothetical protein ACK4VO_08280 [Pseudobdellovibrio sp.]
MKILSLFKKIFLVVLLVLPIFWVFVWNYSFVFKTKIVGEVQAVENVSAEAIIANGTRPLNPQVFSFSVAIKDLKTNEIHMASSEDRQWAAVQKGNCVVAVFFPYEPWKLSKANTNHNARLLKNYMSCQDLPQNESVWDTIKFFFLWT